METQSRPRRYYTQIAFPVTDAHARRPPEVQSVTHARIKGSRRADTVADAGFVDTVSASKMSAYSTALQ